MKSFKEFLNEDSKSNLNESNSNPSKEKVLKYVKHLIDKYFDYEAKDIYFNGKEGGFTIYQNFDHKKLYVTIKFNFDIASNINIDKYFTISTNEHDVNISINQILLIEKIINHVQKIINHANDNDYFFKETY